MGLNAPSTVSEVGKETANLEVRLELRGIYYTLSQIHLAQPCHQKLYKCKWESKAHKWVGGHGYCSGI